MSKQLVFIHGRAQELKDPDALKDEWIEAFENGLKKAKLELPISKKDIHFPYYGDSLFQLVGGTALNDVTKITVRGGDSDQDEQKFLRTVVEEIRQKAGISDAQVAAIAAQQGINRGPLNWGWTQAILKAIDQYVPNGSGASIALATKDVYQYIKNPKIRQVIDEGVCAAIEPGVETVVVSHSLGTVIAYNVLRQKSEPLNWNVPLFVTLGSPLGVREIRKSVTDLSPPARSPHSVSKWYNAMDERDFVALYPLTPNSFPLDPAAPEIENYTNIKNDTRNRHGITGYLNDENVAKLIFEELIK